MIAAPYGETIMPSLPADQPATIADVARLARVSSPTVSRVLTGAARVSPEKTERVLRAIEELGYRPNATARALVNGRSRVIAVLAGDTSRYGYAETIRGIEVSARASGFLVSIAVIDSTDSEEVIAAVDAAVQQAVPGSRSSSSTRKEWPRSKQSRSAYPQSPCRERSPEVCRRRSSTRHRGPRP